MPFRNKNSSADKYLRDTGRGGLKAFVGGETTTFFFSTLISTSLEVSELFSLGEEIDSFFLGGNFKPLYQGTIQLVCISQYNIICP